MSRLPVIFGRSPVRSIPAVPLPVMSSSTSVRLVRDNFLKLPLIALFTSNVLSVSPGAISTSAAFSKARNSLLDAATLPLMRPSPASPTAPV